MQIKARFGRVGFYQSLHSPQRGLSISVHQVQLRSKSRVTSLPVDENNLCLLH